MEPFHYHGGRLFCEDVAVEEIVAAAGTPLYVYSSLALRRCLEGYQQAFSPRSHIVCYAVKSNSNLAVLSMLAKLGAGADIVSGGELFRALKAGIPPEKIVYSGVGKTEREMEEAIDAGILMFNVESVEELHVLDAVASRLGRKARVSIRVNPDVDPKTHPYISTGMKNNKFGIAHHLAVEVYRLASEKDWLEVVGIDCHIGSQLTDVSPFVEAARRLRELIGEIEAAGIVLKYIDIGGGLGIRYRDEEPPSPSEYAGHIMEALDGLDHTIILEPGRSISGNSGLLVTRLLYTKEHEDKTFYVVDAAMNDLARPSLYDAYHEIVPVRPPGGNCRKTVDVVGPICETGDFLARGRELPLLERGALLAVKSSGAYGFTMSSNYNSRPRAAEVLVDGDRFHVVREREEYQDLVKGESIPPWLE